MKELAKYSLGQMVKHKSLEYRGVIIDVDSRFKYSEACYLAIAGKPDKEQPWYHILVDETNYIIYVPEKNINADPSGEPVEHPEIEQYFSRLENGIYQSKFLFN